MVKTSTILLFFASAIMSVAAQRCGPQGGNIVCAAGKCCSQYGWLVALLDLFCINPCYVLS